MMDYLKKISESERYLSNAREVLEKAGRSNGYYKDMKYVKTACGTAYCGALLAAEAYLLKKGVEIIKQKEKRKSVDDYVKLLSKQNWKVLNFFNTTYNILHLSGYYDGELKAKVIQGGFEALEELIDAAKN